MTVALIKGYAGRNAGDVVLLPASVEAALVAQGLASTSVAALTTGPYTQNTTSGRASIAIAAASIVITNNLVDASTKISAVLAQAGADATLLRVERVLAGAGSFTIYGTAAATAAVAVDWALIGVAGQSVVNT